MLLDKLFRIKAYQAILGRKSEPQKQKQIAAILYDLKTFCYADRPTIKYNSNGIDPIAMGICEGRREVWLRILSVLNATDDEINKLIEREINNDRHNNSDNNGFN